MKVVLVLSRLLGFIIIFLSLVILIGYLVSYYQRTFEIDSFKISDYALIAFVFIAAFSYFLAWRHEGLGGLILTLSGIIISFLSDWRFGLPFFIVGQLFVYYWFLLKEQNRIGAKVKEESSVQ